MGEGSQSRPSSCAPTRLGRGFGSHMPALRFFVSGLTILLATIAPCPLSADAGFDDALRWRNVGPFRGGRTRAIAARSEEHTSELQSRRDLVCRLLLEKKK